MALLVLLAGCISEVPSPDPSETRQTTSGTQTNTPGRCQNPGGYSGNAPFLEVFQGTAEQITQRVAAAIDDDVDTIEVAGQISYDAKRVWPALTEDAAVQEIERYVAALGVPGAINVTFQEPWSPQNLRPVVYQVFEAGEIAVINVDTWVSQQDARSQGVVGPMYDLSNSSVAMNAVEAGAIAVENIECVGPRGEYELTKSRLAVSGESIVWVVDIKFPTGGHCGGDRFQYTIDAVTGYIHGAFEQPCI